MINLYLNNYFINCNHVCQINGNLILLNDKENQINYSIIIKVLKKTSISLTLKWYEPDKANVLTLIPGGASYLWPKLE